MQMSTRKDPVNSIPLYKVPCALIAISTPIPQSYKILCSLCYIRKGEKEVTPAFSFMILLSRSLALHLQ